MERSPRNITVIITRENVFGTTKLKVFGPDVGLFLKNILLLQLVVITILTCMCIVLVLFIALFIYAQKHRAEKRRDLSNRVLIHAEAKPEAV